MTGNMATGNQSEPLKGGILRCAQNDRPAFRMTAEYNEKRETTEQSNPVLLLNVYIIHTGRHKSPLCCVIVNRTIHTHVPFNARKDGGFHVAEAKPEISSFFIEASPVWWVGWWNWTNGGHFRGVSVYCRIHHAASETHFS